jgi:hypothetical protein
MSKKSKPDFGLRLMQVIAEKNPHSPLLFEYAKFPGPPNPAWAEELALLQLKHKVLRIEVDERIPIHSRVDGHRWFLTKDRFGIVYLMLVSSVFEEKYVFKLQNRMQQIISRSYDDLAIGNEAALEETRQRLLEVAEQYNSALANNAQADCLISLQESNVQIQEKEVSRVDLNPSTVRSFEDANELSVVLRKRERGVWVLQATVLTALALTGILQILGLIVSVK